MGAKEAFCLLLWAYQGGRISDKGLPKSRPGVRASGNCDDPSDCYRCPLMQQEIRNHPAGEANWVCPACLKDVVQVARAKGLQIKLTGHYTEGQCQYINCVRPARQEFGGTLARETENEDELESLLTGDKEWTKDDVVDRPRGYSRFLQLVIGDINT